MWLECPAIDGNVKGCQWGHVGTVECLQPMAVQFGAAIAAKQFVVEEDSHFGNVQIAGHNQRANHVFTPVRTHFGHRDLQWQRFH